MLDTTRLVLLGSVFELHPHCAVTGCALDGSFAPRQTVATVATDTANCARPMDWSPAPLYLLYSS